MLCEAALEEEQQKSLGSVMLCGLSRSLCLSLHFSSPCHAHVGSLCVFLGTGTASCDVFAPHLIQ